jgi:hypothetical protein
MFCFNHAGDKLVTDGELVVGDSINIPNTPKNPSGLAGFMVDIHTQVKQN